MLKAYRIKHVTVTDPGCYAPCAAGTAESFAKYGAKDLAREGD